MTKLLLAFALLGMMSLSSVVGHSVVGFPGGIEAVCAFPPASPAIVFQYPDFSFASFSKLVGAYDDVSAVGKELRNSWPFPCTLESKSRVGEVKNGENVLTDLASVLSAVGSGKGVHVVPVRESER
jgi:hypothetical protein